MGPRLAGGRAEVTDENKEFFVATARPGRAFRDHLFTAHVVVATVTHTFAQAGKYLVICDFLPHFVEGKMYGYVAVR